MAKSLRLLDQVHIAAACPVKWEAMSGDDRMRHCSICRLNVFNLSDMTDKEAEDFLAEKTGRVCVRYYMRADGRVMTSDCPRGVKALRLRLFKHVSAATMLIVTALGCSPDSSSKMKKAFGLDKFEKPNVAIAGGICLPPPAPASISPKPPVAKGP
jgi:hypothetical protein